MRSGKGQYKVIKQGEFILYSHGFLRSTIKLHFGQKTVYFLSNSSKYFKICNTTDFFCNARIMLCLMKLPLYISSLTNRKMIDTVVMCLGCLCSLTFDILYLLFIYENFRSTTKSKWLSRTNRMEKIYFHKKRLKCMPSN